MINTLDMAQFSGADGYHHWSCLFHNCVLTDGAKYVTDNGGGHGAYWLMDAIASYIPKLRKHRDTRLHDQQFWKLRVKDGQGVLTCRADDGVPPAVTQRFDYTDFDLPEIDIWVSFNGSLWVFMLPSEY